MASMNASTRGRNKTTNISGNPAYVLDVKTKFVTMALTTMLNEAKFYGDNTNELITMAEALCESGEGAFVAKVAVWARTECNMRSVSHALIAVVVRFCSGEPFVRTAVRTVASVRGDDGTEIMAAYLALYGKEDKARHPNALRKGLRDALEGMSPYAIAKYQSKSSEVKLRDVIRLVRPKSHSEAQREAFDACVNGTLPMPKGWETELSERGNTKEVWDELIAEGNLGIFAQLRNLRNMINAGGDIEPVLKNLEDPERIAKSRMLPFRFYSAYVTLKNAGLMTSRVARALDTAMRLACENCPEFEGNTAVMIDTSGSMGWGVSGNSMVTCRDIAAVIGAMVVRKCDNAWVCGFDSTAKEIPMAGLSVIADIESVPSYGGCTYMDRAFELLDRSGFKADRIIVLSDYEVNGPNGKFMQSHLNDYRRKVKRDVWLHAIDLQGYGTSQFNGHNVDILAGWSEKVLDIMAMMEQGVGDVVKLIEDTVIQ